MPTSTDPSDNGKGNNGHPEWQDQIPVVPEENAGWVLILFSGRRCFFLRGGFSVLPLPIK